MDILLFAIADVFLNHEYVRLLSPFPLTVATNVAVLPTHTFAGAVMPVMEGLLFTNTTAAALLVFPQALEATKVKVPASVFAAVDREKFLVSFPTSTPPFCHLNEVAPETSAEILIAEPTHTVDPMGCNVMMGLGVTFICMLVLVVVPQLLRTSTV